MPEPTRNSRAERNELRIATRIAMKAKQNRSKGGNNGNLIRPPKRLRTAPKSSEMDTRTAQSGNASASASTDGQAQREKAFNPTIKEIMEIRRKSMSGLRAESLGLGSQWNQTRENLAKAREKLRTAQDVLQKTKDHAPGITMPIGTSPPAAALKEASRATSRWLKTLRRPTTDSKRPFPKSRVGTVRINVILDIISGLVGILESDKSFQDTKLHGALVAKQKRIVSELQEVVNGLEREDREILAQIEDKQREKQDMMSEND